ncbi:MAG: hypothetical protein RR101_13885 [Burkholderiaceae bacterium]
MKMEKASLFNRPASAGAENFLLEVTGYDTKANPPCVFGKRLDTGEETRVTLRKLKAAEAEKRTNSIEKLSGPVKPGMTTTGTGVGGTLMVEQAFAQPDGSYTARWLTAMTHSPEEGVVLDVVAHVSPVKTNEATGKAWSRVNLVQNASLQNLPDAYREQLKIVDPFVVEDENDLQAGLEELLEYGVGAGVRLRMGSSFDAVYVSQARDRSPQESVAQFMGTYITDSIRQGIADGSCVVEVIPYSTVFVGKKFRENLEKAEPATWGARLSRSNPQVYDPERERARTVAAYQRMFIAVRLSDPNEAGERGIYVSNFGFPNSARASKPLEGLSEAIAYANTPAFAPQLPDNDHLKPEYAAATAPEEDGSFDAADLTEAPAEAAQAAPEEVAPSAPPPQRGAKPGARRFSRGL